MTSPTGSEATPISFICKSRLLRERFKSRPAPSSQHCCGTKSTRIHSSIHFNITTVYRWEKNWHFQIIYIKYYVYWKSKNNCLKCSMWSVKLGLCYFRKLYLWLKLYWTFKNVHRLICILNAWCSWQLTRGISKVWHSSFKSICEVVT